MPYVERVQALVYQGLHGDRLVRDLYEYDGVAVTLRQIVQGLLSNLGGDPEPGDVEIIFGGDTYIVFAAGPLRPRKSWWSA
jgi:hypothetical protein